MNIDLQAIGFVAAPRVRAEDDFWGGERARIRLCEDYPAEALRGLAEFSHVEVLYVFHRVDPDKVVTGARHPRDNPAWPAVGIFAQRAKNRPNRIGSTICSIVGVEDRELIVRELDAIDGTPVVDLKPVMVEFLPRGPVRQPAWSHELMREYWLTRNPSDGDGEARRDMTIETDDLSRPQIHELLEEHLAHMRRISPPESVHALDLDRLRRPGITFWSAWSGSKLLGCGALKELDPRHGEVKSMRTPAALRRRGAGRALLATIVATARSRGYSRLSLETGAQAAFAPAHRLYESCGFARCGPFGDYVDDPNSVFMTFEL
jgi:putative acetyltransferase